MKKGVLFGVAMMGVCVAFGTSSSELQDGEAIFHMPFDEDCLSLVNPAANPPAPLIFKSAGGDLTFSDDVAGGTVVDEVPARENGGSLLLNHSRMFVDVTDFGFDTGLVSATIEFYFKAKASETGDDWAQIICIGPLSTVDAFQNCGVPFRFLVQDVISSDPPYIYFRVDSDDSVSNKDRRTAQASATGFDDVWHHYAMTIEPLYGDDGSLVASEIRVYVDLQEVDMRTHELASPWRGCTPKADQRLYLSIGNVNSTMAVDEFRVSKGVLPLNRMLKLRDVRQPADGETLMHLSFEGDMSTRAHPEEMPVVTLGTPVFSDRVCKPYVAERTGVGRVYQENRGCLEVTDQVSVFSPYWALRREVLDSATLEFFVRGDPNETYTAWGAPFRISARDQPFPFLMQLDDNMKYYLRADATEFVGGEPVSSHRMMRQCGNSTWFKDGKWHHVAMTAKPNADGSTQITFFIDYQQVSQGDTRNDQSIYAWSGLDDGMMFDFGRVTFGRFWIDEVRLTKGVLDKSRFLRMTSHPGLLMLIE